MQSQGDAMELMLLEMKGMSDLIFRMQNSCYNKCIPDMKNADLSMGEMSCIDRCSYKYMSVVEICKEHLNSVANAMPQGN